jgi:hypothetical protein
LVIGGAGLAEGGAFAGVGWRFGFEAFGSGRRKIGQAT